VITGRHVAVALLAGIECWYGGFINGRAARAALWRREENMGRTTSFAVGAAGIAVLLAVTAALAQQPQRVRVRGTVEAVDGPVLSVKSRDGSELKVKLPDNAAVRDVVKYPLADVKPGNFIGVAGMPQPDGSQKALEVLVFPESMRGTGEGHYPWDLQPNSTMTNANVENEVEGVNGRELTLKYKDGDKKIIVPPETPVVTFEPGDKSELKPGAKIFIIALKHEDGTLEAASVNVGRDGLTPPM
jgi:hypothetical protein